MSAGIELKRLWMYEILGQLSVSSCWRCWGSGPSATFWKWWSAILARGIPWIVGHDKFETTHCANHHRQIWTFPPVTLHCHRFCLLLSTNWWNVMTWRRARKCSCDHVLKGQRLGKGKGVKPSDFRARRRSYFSNSRPDKNWTISVARPFRFSHISLHNKIRIPFHKIDASSGLEECACPQRTTMPANSVIFLGTNFLKFGPFFVFTSFFAALPHSFPVFLFFVFVFFCLNLSPFALRNVRNLQTTILEGHGEWQKKILGDGT